MAIMNKSSIFYALLLVAGIAFSVFAGYDDSPGGQMIGIFVVVFAIVGVWKSRRNS